jgi:6-pyruvoyltetrahydropterin/6-carboxytetrahydropterin synthase
MFRLTREVRFTVHPQGLVQPHVTNGHGGYPSQTGFGNFFALRVTLSGKLQADTGYLRNIKEMDQAVRDRGIAVVSRCMRDGTGAMRLPLELFHTLKDCWPGAVLDELELSLSPFLSVGCVSKDYRMVRQVVRLSQKFEFSAAHRLHNPALSEAENRKAFGKCNNPLGHGHNYELQVTLAGEVDTNGLLIDVPEFERIVAGQVIDRVDHKFLNAEVPEFADLIPSVENIARVIFGWLKPSFKGSTQLASVTVWETPKTWCEYSEEF